MERGKQMQIEQDKPLDPYIALKKVIKLDRRLKNFQYHDTAHNVHLHVNYPSVPEPLPGQHLLRSFWRHLQNFYFKPISESDLQILDYISNLVQQPLQRQYWFNGPPQFWELIDQTFADSYLRKFPRSEVDELNIHNTISILYGYYNLICNSGSQPLKMEREQVKKMNELKQKYLPSDDKNYYDWLKTQHKTLRNITPPTPKDKSQINDQIQKLQQQLAQINQQNKIILNRLSNRVRKQINQKIVSTCYNSQQDDSQDQQTIFSKYYTKQDKQLQSLKSIDLKIYYLRYIILNLEKKQVAESISKINRIEKTKGQIKYVISFQKGMNLDSKLVSQQQLTELNNLRQYSLIKFYNTSLKSQYSFICQNFYGFRQIFNNRNKQCSLKNKNILQEMRHSKYQAKEPSNKSFANFQICHHCKLLYPQNLLVSCSYTSDKLGAPIQPTPYYDPYLTQVSKMDGPNSQRLSFRRRNPFMGYAKIDDEYRCQRRFCKYCLKQNYEEGMDKNGLCPFCQGVCFCTRCARNDTIFRIKSMFLVLGGDINQIHDSSQLQKLKKGDTPSEDQPTNRKIQIKSIKKKKLNQSEKSIKKLLTIREQMEQCRILCDMVKKRQKQKYKLIKIRSNIFQHKIKIMSDKYDYKRKLNQIQWKENLQQDQKDIKIKKKHKI